MADLVKLYVDCPAPRCRQRAAFRVSAAEIEAHQADPPEQVLYTMQCRWNGCSEVISFRARDLQHAREKAA